MHLAKLFFIVPSLMVLTACNGVESPASGNGAATSNNQGPKPPAPIASSQMLADGSVYIANLNVSVPEKSALLKDGSVYVVTPKK
jgi:hypothetical protein